MTTANAFLIAYDITCRKRWRRIYKQLKRVGERCQYSVFSVTTTKARAAALERRLRADLTSDDRLMVVDLGPAASSARRIAGFDEPTAPTALIV